MQKTVKMTRKGKTFRTWASEQNIYEFNLKKKLNTGLVLSLSWDYIHIYDLYSQTILLVYI